MQTNTRLVRATRHTKKKGRVQSAEKRNPRVNVQSVNLIKRLHARALSGLSPMIQQTRAVTKNQCYVLAAFRSLENVG